MANATSTTTDQSPFIAVKNATGTGIKYQIVELVIPANSANNQFTFETQSFLRMKQIISIEAYTVVDMPLAPTSGNAVVSSAIFLRSSVTFYGTDPDNNSDKGDWLESIPLIKMHNMHNGTDPYTNTPYTLVPRNIVWEKSQILYQTGSTGVTVDTSYVFLVGYLGTLGD